MNHIREEEEEKKQQSTRRCRFKAKKKQHYLEIFLVIKACDKIICSTTKKF